MNKDTNKIENLLDEDILEEEEADDIDTDAPLDELSGKKSKPKKNKVTRSAGAKRRLRYRVGFTATILIAVAAVVLLNVVVGIVADRYPINWDITKNKTYTISAQSIEIAKKVPHEIEIVVFTDEKVFSEPSTNLPELDTTMREFYNALKQFNTHSGGKITYSFIDPNQQPQKYAAYTEYEVKYGDMLFIAGERHKTATVYSTDFVDYLAYYGTYSNDLFSCSVSNESYMIESNAEKTLTSAVYALSSAEERVVQVLVGHSEDSNVISGLQSLYELNGYTFKSHSIIGSEEFDKDATVMLIAAPEDDYKPEELQRIREWLYNDNNYGRQLMVFVSPTADCPNLYEFLEVEYQITVTDELIVETNLNRLPSQNGLFPMADVDTSSEYAPNAGGGVVYVPTTRRLTTTLSQSLENNTIGSYALPMIQFTTTAKVAKLEDLFNENAGKDASTKAPDDQYPLAGTILHVIDTYNNDTQTAVKGHVLVCGSSQMAYASNIQNSTFVNEELLLDTINGMCGVKDATIISSKVVQNDTVVFTAAASVIVGLGIFTIGVPLVTLVICLVVFIRRKHL